MRDKYHIINVLALVVILALSISPRAVRANEPTIFDLVRQFGPETHVVSWRQPCGYDIYRRWLQTASQWAAQVGADPASGWSYYSVGGSVAVFNAAQEAEPVVAQLRTQPQAPEPSQFAPSITTIWGVGLDFAQKARSAWTGMWAQTWMLQRYTYTYSESVRW